MIAVIIIKAMYSSKECIAFLFVYKYKIAIGKVSTNKHKAKVRTNIPPKQSSSSYKISVPETGTVFLLINILWEYKDIIRQKI